MKWKRQRKEEGEVEKLVGALNDRGYVYVLVCVVDMEEDDWNE